MFKHSHFTFFSMTNVQANPKCGCIKTRTRASPREKRQSLMTTRMPRVQLSIGSMGKSLRVAQ